MMIAPLPLAPAIAAVPTVTIPARQSLIARPHTVLGVCEGIGEDLRFNPVYLRIAFACGIFFAPLAVIATYLVLGLVVAGSRWAFPVTVETAAPVRDEQANDQAEEYRIAA